ncbi:MAG: 16S rRNA (cytidine(1402)-2'-O)-methyltransferase [Succinivibrionaceae bacterium]|jgi:16S rRNA (cytidine1402-2'-O)-methyltransferase|nr:16S rRNA (cytidine(1402)-2'-O)-methyltransferase [Succinivibrionaceae bacterium]MBQ8976025.1 16S rRNA (cytidine(1402)-2'-O)-methyltransferase [Succinivibrionaceae bacterium]
MDNVIENALYIVPTPIGNLTDLTMRAVETLKNVDYIGAEDTRHSQLLLDHYGIKTKMFSLHDYNEIQKRDYLVNTIRDGKAVALISDAGTPLISDPGYHVVSYCREQGVKVIPLPGPCAAITALSASGLPTDKFIFMGFLPTKEKALQQELQSIADETRTCVFYESPKRIIYTMEAVAEVLGAERRVVIGRELTKTFESFYDLPAGQMLEFLKEEPNRTRGEFVLMIAGVKNRSEISSSVVETMKLLLKELPLKKVAAVCASIYNLKKNELYDYALNHGLTGRDC